MSRAKLLSRYWLISFITDHDEFVEEKIALFHDSSTSSDVTTSAAPLFNVALFPLASAFVVCAPVSPSLDMADTTDSVRNSSCN
uniref:Uncharacterized protein n=1 Tax=Physcomitrium patens TaxID=3218 RepID=A0A2K1L7U0_PHYPA|nr:hypothetical protein PHYPA_000533 [Physcomitrium patens]